MTYDTRHREHDTTDQPHSTPAPSALISLTRSSQSPQPPPDTSPSSPRTTSQGGYPPATQRGLRSLGWRTIGVLEIEIGLEIGLGLEIVGVEIEIG